MASKKYPAKNQPANPAAKPRPQATKKNAIKGDLSKWYVIPGVIFALCFVLYGNSIKHDYALDDDIYTRKNVYVQKGFSELANIFDKGSLYGFNGVGESQYRPLSLLDFMVEVQMFGLNPHVNHFFNVLFFALTCILLYFLLKRLLPNYNKIIPLAIVFLYLFHPIHTEVVANIKSRDEILGMMFGIASLLFLMKYDEDKKQSNYLWSIVLFAISVFSKENYLMFAIIIPLVLYFFSSNNIKRIARLTAPFAGIVLFYLLIRSAVLTSNTFKGGLDIINNSLMATNSGIDRLATEIVMLGKYLYLLVIPYPLSWDYSYNQIPIVSFANIWATLSLLIYLALAVYVVKSLVRKERSIYVFVILFYAITMFLTSNIAVKIGSSFAERFLYAPSLSFCMVLPLGIARALKLDPENDYWRQKSSFYGVLGVILLVYASILIPRNNDWVNNYNLFLAGVKASPNSARAHSSLGSEYRTQAEMSRDANQRAQFYELSIGEYRKALDIYKDAESYYNMGVSFYEMGLQDSALKVYEKAIASDPHYTMALNNIGVIYFNRKQYDQAISYFIKDYTQDTNDVQVLVNIGAAYQNLGNVDKTLYYYNIVLRKDPNNANVASNLTSLYVASGMSYFDKQDYDNAVSQFQLALKYDPRSANALGNIGAVYQKKGDYAKAMEYYQKALAIDPNNKTFRDNLQQITGK
jgi:tetratricopeptide (TPR) repeat protein